MIRFTPTENSKPQIGDILLSEPFLNDPYFGRKAVLICEINKSGSFGLVLNNIIDMDITEVISGFPDPSARISLGGPVSRSNLFFLHTSEKIKDSQKVINGIYLGGDFEQLKEEIKTSPNSGKSRLKTISEKKILLRASRQNTDKTLLIWNFQKLKKSGKKKEDKIIIIIDKVLI